MTVLAAALAGCATPPPPAPVAEEVPGVQVAVDAALKRFDAHEHSADQAALPAQLTSARGPLSVYWEGEAADILQKIAQANHLAFEYTGPHPRLPLPVFVRMKDATLEQVLERIGGQLGGRAQVRLYDSRIELRAKLY